MSVLGVLLIFVCPNDLILSVLVYLDVFFYFLST